MPSRCIYDNGGTGDVYGAELIARHDFTANLTGWLAYTLSRAERRDSRRDRAAPVRLRPDPHPDPGRQLPPAAQLAGGRPLPPGQRQPEHARGRLGLQRQRRRYEPIYGEVNSARDRTFHQLDLRIDKRWIYQSWMFNAYLDIQNVYNRENPEGLSYNFDYSESEPQTGLPLLTIFGLKAEF